MRRSVSLIFTLIIVLKYRDVWKGMRIASAAWKG